MAKQNKVGEAYVEVGGDIAPLDGALKKAEKNVQGFTTKSQKAFDKFDLVAGAAMVSAYAAVAAFVVDSVREMAKLDQALNRTATAVAKTGVAMKDARKFVDDYANSIEQMTAFQDTEALNSFNGLLRLTNDVQASMQLNALAMDMVTQNGGDLSQTAEMLGLAFQGNTRGVAGLAKELGVAGDNIKDVNRLFKQAQERFGGAAQTSLTLGGETAKLGNNLSNLIKDQLQPLVKWLTLSAKGYNELFQAARGGVQDAAAVHQKENNRILGRRLDLLAEIQKMEANRVAAGMTGVDLKSYEAQIQLRRDEVKALEAEYRAANSGNGGPKKIDLGKVAQDNFKKNNTEAEEAKRLKAAENRLEVLNQEIDLRNKLVDQMVAYAQAQEAIAAAFIGPVATSMQTFFEEMQSGLKSMQDFAEAVAKAIGKSFINMMAQVLEQKAAMAFAEAMGDSLNPFTALLAPGQFSKAALLASAAGGLRAVAANMAEGGRIKHRPGGTLINAGERGEDEFIVPARKMGNFAGGGVKVDKVQLVYNGIKDAADAMSSGRAIQSGYEIIQAIDTQRRGQGLRTVRGG